MFQELWMEIALISAVRKEAPLNLLTRLNHDAVKGANKNGVGFHLFINTWLLFKAGA